jgi:hypothetical protein
LNSLFTTAHPTVHTAGSTWLHSVGNREHTGTPGCVTSGEFKADSKMTYIHFAYLASVVYFLFVMAFLAFAAIQSNVKYVVIGMLMAAMIIFVAEYHKR